MSIRGPVLNQFVVLLAVMLLSSQAGLSQADEGARDVLEKVKRKYDTIQDARLKFSQRVTFERTNLEQSSKGTLFLKNGNRYRLELGEQTIVTNGAIVWSYSQATNQVIIDKFKMDERLLTPEKVLTGAPEDFIPSSLGKERIGDMDVIALKLVPRDDRSFLSLLKLWVDVSSWLIRRAEVVDANGKTTEYEIEDVKMNIGLDDDLFVYEIPPGADVVDLR
jgi:outer membrane lipoprotein carrier protein